MTPNPDRINQVVLASLWLTAHRKREDYAWRAWKGHDWDALNRLHEAGLIDQPRNKNKSITFTEKGAEAAEAAFAVLCGAESGEGEATNKIVPMPGGRSAQPDRQPFPSSAIKLWESIPQDARQEILAQAWCSHCRDARRLVDFTGIPDDRNDLILRGFCADCGQVIVRLVETGDASRPPQPPPEF